MKYTPLFLLPFLLGCSEKAISVETVYYVYEKLEIGKSMKDNKGVQEIVNAAPLHVKSMRTESIVEGYAKGSLTTYELHFLDNGYFIRYTYMDDKDEEGDYVSRLVKKELCKLGDN